MSKRSGVTVPKGQAKRPRHEPAVERFVTIPANKLKEDLRMLATQLKHEVPALADAYTDLDTQRRSNVKGKLRRMKDMDLSDFTGLMQAVCGLFRLPFDKDWFSSSRNRRPADRIYTENHIRGAVEGMRSGKAPFVVQALNATDAQRIGFPSDVAPPAHNLFLVVEMVNPSSATTKQIPLYLEGRPGKLMIQATVLSPQTSRHGPLTYASAYVPDRDYEGAEVSFNGTNPCFTEVPELGMLDNSFRPSNDVTAAVTQALHSFAANGPQNVRMVSPGMKSNTPHYRGMPLAGSVPVPVTQPVSLPIQQQQNLQHAGFGNTGPQSRPRSISDNLALLANAPALMNQLPVDPTQTILVPVPVPQTHMQQLSSGLGAAAPANLASPSLVAQASANAMHQANNHTTLLGDVVSSQQPPRPVISRDRLDSSGTTFGPFIDEVARATANTEGRLDIPIDLGPQDLSSLGERPMSPYVLGDDWMDNAFDINDLTPVFPEGTFSSGRDAFHQQQWYHRDPDFEFSGRQRYVDAIVAWCQTSSSPRQSRTLVLRGPVSSGKRIVAYRAVAKILENDGKDRKREVYWMCESPVRECVSALIGDVNILRNNSTAAIRKAFISHLESQKERPIIILKSLKRSVRDYIPGNADVIVVETSREQDTPLTGVLTDESDFSDPEDGRPVTDFDSEITMSPMEADEALELIARSLARRVYSQEDALPVHDPKAGTKMMQKIFDPVAMKAFTDLASASIMANIALLIGSALGSFLHELKIHQYNGHLDQAAKDESFVQHLRSWAETKDHMSMSQQTLNLKSRPSANEYQGLFILDFLALTGDATFPITVLEDLNPGVKKTVIRAAVERMASSHVLRCRESGGGQAMVSISNPNVRERHKRLLGTAKFPEILEKAQRFCLSQLKAALATDPRLVKCPLSAVLVHFDQGLIAETTHWFANQLYRRDRPSLSKTCVDAVMKDTIALNNAELIALAARYYLNTGSVRSKAHELMSAIASTYRYLECIRLDEVERIERKTIILCSCCIINAQIVQEVGDSQALTVAKQLYISAYIRAMSFKPSSPERLRERRMELVHMHAGMAYIYRVTRDIDKAVHQTQEVLKVLKELGDYRSIPEMCQLAAHSYYTLAHLTHVREWDSDQCVKYLDQALEHYKLARANPKDDLLDICYGTWDVHALRAKVLFDHYKMGDAQETYAAICKEIQISDFKKDLHPYVPASVYNNIALCAIARAYLDYWENPRQVPPSVLEEIQENLTAAKATLLTSSDRPRIHCQLTRCRTNCAELHIQVLFTESLYALLKMYVANKVDAPEDLDHSTECEMGLGSLDRAIKIARREPFDRSRDLAGLYFARAQWHLFIVLFGGVGSPLVHMRKARTHLQMASDSMKGTYLRETVQSFTSTSDHGALSTSKSGFTASALHTGETVTSSQPPAVGKSEDDTGLAASGHMNAVISAARAIVAAAILPPGIAETKSSELMRDAKAKAEHSRRQHDVLYTPGQSRGATYVHKAAKMSNTFGKHLGELHDRLTAYTQQRETSTNEDPSQLMAELGALRPYLSFRVLSFVNTR